MCIIVCVIYLKKIVKKEKKRGTVEFSKSRHLAQNKKYCTWFPNLPLKDHNNRLLNISAISSSAQLYIVSAEILKIIIMIRTARPIFNW